MKDRIHDEIGVAARHLRVETLVLLRWIAIIGQTIAILYVYYYLKFKFPIGLCFVAVATSAILNLALRAGAPRSFRLEDSEAAVLLGYDILELAALLYLTGGVVNSFAMLFLAPVMISAVSLPRNLTLVLGILMVAVATLLVVEYEPLPWHENEPLQFPLLYRLGVWAALTLSAAFVAMYAGRVSDEARELAGALAATELVLEHAQHLTQLDGLAAAAAHELGTPLATITLTVSELQKATKETAPAIQDDLALLAQEARRCREILRKLNSLGTDEAHVLNVLTIETLIEEVVDPLRDQEVNVVVSRFGPSPAPACVRNPGLLYGLGNLVENAVDFAQAKVKIEARWTDRLVSITILDDGPGFSPKVLDRVGDPYVRENSAHRRLKTDPEAGMGLGLGLFIAKTLLERSGALVEFANAPAPATGANVRISWPREVFERRTRPQGAVAGAGPAGIVSRRG
ncbi:MAG TPA: ActS/PrrB/RegB family redox-sensitive histidine kinase [Methylocystis sp.]|nr:ActS/PrrB/RegB family redox-sensitive histidine kinase [Methylocystis sp.]